MERRLAGMLPGEWSALRSVEPLGIKPGRTHVARIVSAGGREAIVKLFEPRERTAWLREVAALTRLRRSVVPVPEVLASGEASDGSCWLIETVLEGSPPNVPRSGWESAPGLALSREFGRMLASLHGSTQGARRFGGVGEPTRNTLAELVIPRVTSRFDEAAVAIAGDRLAAKLVHRAGTRLDRWFDAIREGDMAHVRPTLLHRDYGMSNVMAEERESGWKITGVFDFEDAYAGDPVEDFKWWALEWFGRQPLEAMWGAYTEQRPLDEGAADRLVVYAVELAVDMCSWKRLTPEQRDRALALLEAAVAGERALR